MGIKTLFQTLAEFTSFNLTSKSLLALPMIMDLKLHFEEMKYHSDSCTGEMACSRQVDLKRRFIKLTDPSNPP